MTNSRVLPTSILFPGEIRQFPFGFRRILCEMTHSLRTTVLAKLSDRCIAAYVANWIHCLFATTPLPKERILDTMAGYIDAIIDYLTDPNHFEMITREPATADNISKLIQKITELSSTPEDRWAFFTTIILESHKREEYLRWIAVLPAIPSTMADIQERYAEMWIYPRVPFPKAVTDKTPPTPQECTICYTVSSETNLIVVPKGHLSSHAMCKQCALRLCRSVPPVHPPCVFCRVPVTEFVMLPAIE